MLSSKNKFFLVHTPIVFGGQAPQGTNCFINRQQTSLAWVIGRLEENMQLLITGVPGMGKTELAIQVFKSSIDKNKYKRYFWLNASSELSFNSDLLQTARALNIAHELEDINDIRQCILNFLRTEDSWLMILDNVDDFDLIEGFRPFLHGQRHVIITARRSRATNINTCCIQLDSMQKSEAVELLLKAYTYSRDISDKEPKNEESAGLLVEELGLHPLAIVQAAAYLRANQDTIPSYVEMYQEKKRELFQWKPFHERDYVPVLTTMILSFSKLKKDVRTVRLFCAIAFLSPDSIPQPLCEQLIRDSDQIQSRSETAPSRKLRLDSALEPLFAYSFVKRVSDGSISIHRLVQYAFSKRSWAVSRKLANC